MVVNKTCGFCSGKSLTLFSNVKLTIDSTFPSDICMVFVTVKGGKISAESKKYWILSIYIYLWFQTLWKVIYIFCGRVLRGFIIKHLTLYISVSHFYVQRLHIMWLKKRFFHCVYLVVSALCHTWLVSAFTNRVLYCKYVKIKY